MFSYIADRFSQLCNVQIGAGFEINPLAWTIRGVWERDEGGLFAGFTLGPIALSVDYPAFAIFRGE